MFKEICRRANVRMFVVGLLALLIGSMTLSPSLFSQSASTGALSGTLKDSSGAVVPNATVTLTSIDTAQLRTTTTSADGTYKFGLLPPGNYGVKFEAAGFNALEVPSVTVSVTETAVLDQTLQVGAQTQEVEVRAQTAAIQTESTAVGTVVNSQTVTETPLTTRNYTNLLGLSSGANSAVFNASTLGKGTTDISVNGSTTSQNNFMQDGAPIVAWTGNGYAADSGGSPGIAVVSPDAVEEFKIQTSLFDAGYGRKPGASVNVVTKSGTNQFHGTAFEFFRNTDLNANDFFRKLNVAPLPNGRAVLNQNQFGGVFGGPVKKDKLFFFASYQETRQANGLSVAGASTPTLVGIPSGARNTAAFQTALGQAFCPGGSATIGQGASVNGPSIQTTGYTKLACNGSNINPVALKILQLQNADGTYLVPGSSTGLNQSVFESSPAKYTEHQAVGNFDYVINDKNTFSGRWTYSDAITNGPIGCNITSTSLTLCLPEGSGALVQIPTQYVTGKLTTSLTSNLVNEARASLQRSVGKPENTTPFTDAQVGMAPLEPSVPYLNGITVTGLFTFGAVLKNATDKFNLAYEFADQVSWSHGKHTIRAGFEYERDRQDWHFPGLAIGSLTFKTFQDFLLGLPGCPPGTVPCSASTAAGVTNGTAQSNISSSGNSVGITPAGGEDFQFRAPTANAFVQDDFKVRSNLTLNLGVRWEWFPLNYAANGENTNIWVQNIALVPNSQLGTTAQTGTLAGYVVPSNFPFSAFPAPPVGGLFVNNSKNTPTLNNAPIANFGPRIGLAWKPLPSDRLVFRTGFGTFYDRAGNTIYNKSATQGSPYDTPVAQSGAANWFSTEASPYCSVPTAGISVNCATPALGWTPRFFNPANNTGSTTAVLSANPVYLVPVTYEWNANVQYEFVNQWVLELGYVGSRGVHQVPDATVGGGILEHNVNQPLLVCAGGITTNCVGTTPQTGGLDCGQPSGCITTNTSANAALRVPYLGFSPSGIGVDQTISDSHFNSLQATVTKRFSRGLQMQAAYTWARGFTTASYIAYNNAALPLVYGPMPYLRPQRFSVNYAYDLPFGKHEGILDKVTNGWVVSGVTVVQNGVPLTITDANGGNIYASGGAAQTSTAQLCGCGIPVATSGSDKSRLGGVLGGPGWMNIGAFTKFSSATNNFYGNSGYGIVPGPGQFNWDISLVKTTKVGGINENAVLVFRSEFFNAFNHAQFANPVTSSNQTQDVTQSTFGQITGTSVNPRLIQFALKYVF
jgi:carboxypeptidase family protein/TonB-dependent receptor-like protein